MIRYIFVDISPSYDIRIMFLFFLFVCFCKIFSKVPNWILSLSSNLLKYSRERRFVLLSEERGKFQSREEIGLLSGRRDDSLSGHTEG